VSSHKTVYIGKIVISFLKKRDINPVDVFHPRTGKKSSGNKNNPVKIIRYTKEVLWEYIK